MNVGTEIEAKRRSDEQQDSRKNIAIPTIMPPRPSEGTCGPTSVVHEDAPRCDHRRMA
jgi:hypothetical protein